MDQEDLQDQVGGTALTSNENYRDYFSSFNNDESNGKNNES